MFILKPFKAIVRKKIFSRIMPDTGFSYFVQMDKGSIQYDTKWEYLAATSDSEKQRIRQKTSYVYELGNKDIEVILSLMYIVTIVCIIDSSRKRHRDYVEMDRILIYLSESLWETCYRFYRSSKPSDLGDNPIFSDIWFRENPSYQVDIKNIIDNVIGLYSSINTKIGIVKFYDDISHKNVCSEIINYVNKHYAGQLKDIVDYRGYKICDVHKYYGYVSCTSEKYLRFFV